MNSTDQNRIHSEEVSKTSFNLNIYHDNKTERRYLDKTSLFILEKINLNYFQIIQDNYPTLDLEWKKSLKTVLGKLLFNQKHSISSIYKNAYKNRKTKKYEGFEYGRLFSTNSLQTIERKLRHTIIDKNSFDVDMVNAHPVILQAISRFLKVKTPILDKYIEDRDYYLNELVIKYSLTRDEAKAIPLAVINSGNRSNKYEKVFWIKELEGEIEEIYNSLIEEPLGKRIFDHVHKINKKNKKGELIHSDGRILNLRGTIINLALCKVENEILDICISFFEERNIDIYTLCFDGLIVNNNFIPDEIINSLEERVYNTIGINMKFKIKPFDEGFSEEYINSLPISKPIIDNKRKDMDFSPLGFQFHKACMGYGKSTYLRKFISNSSTSSSDESFIFITPRITLAKETFELLKDYGFQLYSEVKEWWNCKRLIIQIDSLHKIEFSYENLIMDECETITSHLVNFDQMKYKDKNVEMLETLLNRTKRTIFMDANLSDETIEIMKKYNPHKEVTISNYSFQPFKNKNVEIISSHSSKKPKEEYLNYITQALKDGKKIICPLNSLRLLKQINHSIKTELNSDDVTEDNHLSENDLIEKIKVELPEKKILCISSEEEHSFSSVDDFKNYDLVIYTSTLLCGNNFDEEHFDEIVGYSSNTHSSAKLYSQQLLRCRKFKEIKIFFYDALFLRRSLTRSKLLQTWRNERSERESRGINFLAPWNEFKEDFYFDITVKEILESADSSCNFIFNLSQILDIHGFNIKIKNLEDIIPQKKIKLSNLKECLEEDIKKIINSKKIKSEEIENPKTSKAEKTRFFIENTFRVNIGNEVFDEESLEFIKTEITEEHIKKVQILKDNINEHKNFITFLKYDNKTLEIEKEKEEAKYNSVISSLGLKGEEEFLKRKGLEYMINNKLSDYINKKEEKFVRGKKTSTNKFYNFDETEFIDWFNKRTPEEEKCSFKKLSKKTPKEEKCDLRKKYEKKTKSVDWGLSHILKPWGITTERDTHSKGGKFIKTTIDYEKYNIPLEKCIDKCDYSWLLKDELIFDVDNDDSIAIHED